MSQEQTIPVLEVSNLHVGYSNGSDFTRIVHDVSFSVAAGEVVALVGESGSGKTSTSQAIIGLLPEGGKVEKGIIRLNGTDISGWNEKRLRSIRGPIVSLVPQDPSASLNPVLTIGAQVAEILKIHGRAKGQDAFRQAVDLLGHVGLSQPELRARQYPHELSGGMRQRVLIAIAIALQPALIIADEPTSALDVTVQKHILDLLDTLRREYGTAILFVTHDLGVAADRSDRIIVLQHGRIQEQGRTEDVLANPASAYTRRLLADAPSLTPAAPRIRPIDAEQKNAVTVQDLVQDFKTVNGIFRAVDGVSFEVKRGTTHALVGESGSGKTTTIRTIAGFHKATSGTILIEERNVSELRREELRQFRRSVQLVYQNPFGSLDPRQSIFSIIEEPLLNFDPISKNERRIRVEQIIDRVGLPHNVSERPPSALSGGQRQRVAIARALVLKPEIVILDEAVSALDVTVQARILELLDELQRDLGLTYLFVSHDLAVVRQIADTVSVLRNGKQVDYGDVESIFRNPTSDYTRELIDAIPGKNFPDKSFSDQHKILSENISG